MGELNVWQAVYVAFAGLFMFKSVFSNFCIIYVILSNKEMRTSTNIFIANLAVGDILMGGVILPMMVHDISHTGEFHEGEFACRFVTALPILCITSSIYSLVVMAVERYRAICTKKGSMSKGTAKKFSVGCWCLSIMVSLPTFAEYAVKRTYHEEFILTEDGHYQNYTRSCGNVVGWTYGLVNGIFIFLCSYIIPLILISASYTRVAMFIQVQAKKQEESAGPNNKGNFTLLKNKVRVIKMLVVVAVLFAVSWAPYFVLLLISKITGRDGSEEAAGAVYLIRLSLSIFSVSYNVYLYMYFTASFRASFKKLLCPCLLKPSKVEDSAPSEGTATSEAPPPK